MARLNYPAIGGGGTIINTLHNIGEPFYIWDNLEGTEAPDNSGAEKYVRLTAGQSGSGGYNEGLLINESVSGSGPLVVATAEIAVGPMAGQVISLLNTERALLRAGTNSGTLEFDQMQIITGSHRLDLTRNPTVYDRNLQGAFSGSGTWSSAVTPSATIATTPQPITSFNSANSPGARTGDRTRDKARIITGYLRII